MEREKTNESFFRRCTLLAISSQKVFQFMLRHKQRLFENDAGVHDSLEGKVAESTGRLQEALHLFVSEHLGGNDANRSHVGKSNLIAIVVLNNKVAYSLDDIVHKILLSITLFV